MILYSYFCKNCQREIEEFFRMGHAPSEVRCVHCGEDARRSYHCNFHIDTYVPGTNGKEDMERAQAYYDKRLYSEDQNKQGVEHLKNLREV